MHKIHIADCARSSHDLHSRMETTADAIQESVMDGDEVWYTRDGVADQVTAFTVLETIMSGDNEDLKDRFEEYLGQIIRCDAEAYDVAQSICTSLANDFIKGKVK